MAPVQEVPVPCVVDREDVEFRMVEQIVPVHRKQLVEKVVEVPKAPLSPLEIHLEFV